MNQAAITWKLLGSTTEQWLLHIPIRKQKQVDNMAYVPINTHKMEMHKNDHLPEYGLCSKYLLPAMDMQSFPFINLHGTNLPFYSFRSRTIIWYRSSQNCPLQLQSKILYPNELIISLVPPLPWLYLAIFLFVARSQWFRLQNFYLLYFLIFMPSFRWSSLQSLNNYYTLSLCTACTNDWIMYSITQTCFAFTENNSPPKDTYLSLLYMFAIQKAQI